MEKRTQIEKLRELCKVYGFELIEDPSYHAREDFLGTPGLQCDAQLCKNKIIAVPPEAFTDFKNYMAYSISHELAHGLVGFCDEKDVLLEQATILARWVDILTRE
jgi:hypothetical protein